MATTKRELEKETAARLNLYYSAREKELLRELSIRSYQVHMNRFVRILINFIAEREDIFEEFAEYALSYMDANKMRSFKSKLLFDSNDGLEIYGMLEKSDEKLKQMRLEARASKDKAQ